MFHSTGRAARSLYVCVKTLADCCYMFKIVTIWGFLVCLFICFSLFVFVENGSLINSSQKVCVLID